MQRMMSWILLAATALWAVPSNADEPLRKTARMEMDRIVSETGMEPSFVSVRSDGSPSLISGTLSLPKVGKAEMIARDFVQLHGRLFTIESINLKLAKLVPNGTGKTVRFTQTYKGIPVVGAHLAMVVRKDGVVRTVSSSLKDLGEIDINPKVSDMDAALAALDEKHWFIPSDLIGFYSRLVILARPEGGALAWEMHFGAIPALMSNYWVYVDARTGKALRYENRIATQYRGRAFQTNPGPSGNHVNPVEVDINVPEGGYEYDTDGEFYDHVLNACDYADTDSGAAADCPDGEAVWLRHELYMSRNCPDYHEMIELELMGMQVPAHFCTEAQTAVADTDGNYFFDWAGTHNGLNDQDMNDKFAEVQMFYHVDKVYNYFLDLMNDYDGSNQSAQDWVGHDLKPMMATVNFKIPLTMAELMGGDIQVILQKISDPNGEMYPFDNAMFVAGGPSSAGIPGFSRPYDSIMFGQGTAVDFSWDGDVIYHEFSHAMENSVSVGVGNYQEFGDQWGVNPEQGGLSEGYADIFAAFITNEPTMGEYSLGSQSRHMEGDDVCPKTFWGEVHYDSPVWSQSVYEARTAVAGDDEEAKHKFEQASFIALSSIVEEQGFAEAAAATLTAVEDLLGTGARTDAEEMFIKHNTQDCARVEGSDGDSMERNIRLDTPALVSGVKGNPYTPGINQFYVTIAEGVEALNFTMNFTSGGTGGIAIPGTEEQGEPDMKIIVRHGESIQFSYDYSAEENVLVDDDVMGPYSLDSSDKFSLVGIDGEALSPGTYYVMPVNAGEARGTMNNLKLFAGDAAASSEGTHEYGSIPSEDGDDTDTGDADTGDDPDTSDSDTDTNDSDGDGDGDDDGCGCANVGMNNSGSASLLKSLLQLL